MIFKYFQQKKKKINKRLPFLNSSLEEMPPLKIENLINTPAAYSKHYGNSIAGNSRLYLCYFTITAEFTEDSYMATFTMTKINVHFTNT